MCYYVHAPECSLYWVRVQVHYYYNYYYLINNILLHIILVFMVSLKLFKNIVS